MPKQTLSAAEAARALGISLDTLRRWDRAGKIRVERDSANRRVVAATEVERLKGGAASEKFSARNRFRGVVRTVTIEGLLAQVEIDVTEPARVVAIITRESAEQLALEARHERGGRRQVHERDGRAVNTRLVIVGSLVAALAAAASPRRSRLQPGSHRHSDPSSSLRLRSTEVLPRIEPDASYSFGSPNPLAEQIRAGRRSTCTSPRAPSTRRRRIRRDWRASRLRSRRTRSSSSSCPLEPSEDQAVFDLAKRPKLRLVVAGPKVPIGLYTREVLKRWAPQGPEEDREPRARRQGHRREGRARSRPTPASCTEPTLRPSRSRARAIPIPARAQPTVVYELAIAAEPQGRRGRTGLRHRGARPGWAAALRARSSGCREATPFAVALVGATAPPSSSWCFPIVAIFAELLPASPRRAHERRRA